MVHVRQASEADIEEIMLVERDWPESQQADRDQILGRLRKFPEGFWIFERDGAQGSEVIGTLMGFPLRYEPANVAAMSTWDAVTNYGDYPDIDLSTANALYLAAGSLRRHARGGTGYRTMMETPIDVARRFGLDYVLAGAKIPGYDAYCKRFGDIDAREYAFLEVNGCLVDPFLEMYRGHDYFVPDRAHIVKDYYPDPPSRDYGALVVRRVSSTA